jgi:NAD(P)-dependent dehydrogenase (short-subunit alcohol dehydrogenase family)
MMKVQNSVALVTGGNRGIGEAFVRAFAAAGVRRVYAACRNKGDAAHLVLEAPDRIVEIQLDVTDSESVAQAALACDDVSILVNNAGLFCNQTLMRAKDMSLARAEMEVNYFGPLAMSRAFAPVLAKHGRSAIVNVLSAGGLAALPIMGGYSPSKFAARAMSTCIRAELADQGTSVSALFVGSVDTRMANHVLGAKERPETIATEGLTAIERGTDEVDTDSMAIEVRASMLRDPKSLERRFAKSLKATQVSTGR